MQTRRWSKLWLLVKRSLGCLSYGGRTGKQASFSGILDEESIRYFFAKCLLGSRDYSSFVSEELSMLMLANYPSHNKHTWDTTIDRSETPIDWCVSIFSLFMHLVKEKSLAISL
ncbi:unnamed protein product [Musa textilis]